MSAPRCYLTAEVLALLKMPRSTFEYLKRAGALPCLEEITPRLGRRVRYRADLVDRWVAGLWNSPRAFRHAGQRRRGMGIV